MIIEEIYQLAFDFRCALEYVVEEGKYGRLTVFAHFPNGCCTYASDLLAEYLVENGVARERIQLMNGEYTEYNYTHSWLMIDEGMYLDISADQFIGKTGFEIYGYIPKCCAVSCGTYIYVPFENGKLNASRYFGIDSYSGDIPYKLREVYNAVMRRLHYKKEM
jgi:hypothetical protein